ncbi:8-oxoguanine deaminase [Candidatus Sumerlaeota bacterium]|nr:8-oxoguanine deaminase [Candidatus Sumerlaeota bacterium]
MKSLLVKNARLIATFDNQMNRFEGADIFIKGPSITTIGKNLQQKADNVIDATDMIAIPGLINSHHHFYQTLTRAVPAVQDAKLFDWLAYLYEIWRHITPEAVYWSALGALSELLLTGCSTTTDHLYLFPRIQNPNLIDEEIRAAQEIGVRFHPTRGSMSLGKSQGGLPPDDVVQDEETILLDSERLIKKYHDPSPFSMLRIALAPCSPFSVTPRLMRETAALARKHKVLLHTHLAETRDEDDYCQNKLGLRPLDYMKKLDWIGNDVWFAHCVYLNKDEIKFMAETKTGVAHCPSSNMRLGSGAAPIPEMIEAGVPVSLAVDGSASNDASDMLGEVRQCMLLHRLAKGVKSMSALQALKIATRGGAEVFRRNDIGSLEPGKAADIALFDLNRLDLAGALHDPLAALVFCGVSHRAHTVIVNGEIVVQKGRLLRVDEEQIAKEMNKHSQRMIQTALECG